MEEAGHEVTKLAFVIENGSALQSRDPELVLQFAEICIHLEGSSAPHEPKNTSLL